MPTMPTENVSLTINSKSLKNLIDHNRRNDWPDILDMERMFCYEYIANGHSLAGAAKAAKMSRANGLKALRKPLVHACIQDMISTMGSRKIMDAEFIETQMLELYDIAMGNIETKCVDRDGEVYSGLIHNLPVAAKLLTEMAKTTKIYEDGSAQGGTVNIGINMGALGISPSASSRMEIKTSDILEGEFTDG